MEDEACAASLSSNDGHQATIRTFAADTLSSWIAFCSSLVVAHPLDTIRVRWQTLGQTPMHTLRVDGVRSLFPGIEGPALGFGPVLSLMFALNEKTRDVLARRRIAAADQSAEPPGWLNRPYVLSGYTPFELFNAGLVAGAVVGVPLCPIAVVRVHQQNSARAGCTPLSVRDVSAQLWRHEGIRGFFRCGLVECAFTGVGRGIYFLSYETLKEQLRGTALGSTWAGDWAAALTTCVFWWLCIFPTDLVKTRVQAEPLATPRHLRPYRGSALECVRQTYRAGGVRAFYTGFFVTLARSLASSGTALPIYDALRPKLRSALGVSPYTITTPPAPSTDR